MVDNAQPGLLGSGCGIVAAVVRLGVPDAGSRVGALAGLAGNPPDVLGLGLGLGMLLVLGLGDPVGLGPGLGEPVGLGPGLAHFDPKAAAVTMPCLP